MQLPIALASIRMSAKTSTSSFAGKSSAAKNPFVPLERDNG